MSESGDIWTAWAFSFFVHMFLDPINQSQSAASSFLEENVGFLSAKWHLSGSH